MKPVYSIVAPVYNEEGILREFYRRVSVVMNDMGEEWELVMVNDGSRDSSLEIMQALAVEDPHVRYINFARNFGHQTAVTAGIDYAFGDAIILIDTDLQDPPEVIPDMAAQWKAGYDVVYAIRAKRVGESWFKLATAGLFYRMLYRITEVAIPLDTGDFRLIDAKVANVLRNMREHNRFIRGMTSWVGFKQTGVEYERAAREWGDTKYPLRKMIRFALDGMTGFSFFPLQIMGTASAVLGVLAIVVAIVIATLRLSFGNGFFGGQATTIVLLLLLSSFQLFFLFVMGLYVARIYDETRGRPLYVVASTAGFEKQTESSHISPPPHDYIVASTGGYHEQPNETVQSSGRSHDE